MMPEIQRREFLDTLRRTSAGALMAQGLFAAADSKADRKAESKDERRGDMIYRRLGRTNERVSAIGLGGSHIANKDDRQLAVRIVRAAIDRGITFMDNCWDYHDGKSEMWMGDALRDGYREKVFLMTKF